MSKAKTDSKAILPFITYFRLSSYPYSFTTSWNLLVGLSASETALTNIYYTWLQGLHSV